MITLRSTCTVAAAIALLPALSFAQPVDATRGVDRSVNYAALKDIAPWDDRNYQLTRRDLALLAKNEADLRVAIPVFYRVQLRKQWPDLPRDGQVQYPHSVLPRFLIEHRGYLVDGKFYRGADRARDGRWSVLTSQAPVAEVDENNVVIALEGESRVTSPNGGAESSIEVSPIDPNVLVAGSNGPGSGQRMHYSFDGGVTWNESAPLPLGGTCCDPTIGWSTDGRFVYTATLGSQNFFYRSSDNGQTWDDLATENGDPRREISAGGFVDKEFLHVDRSTDSPFQDNIYLTWHESNIMRFARSTDFGNTFQPVISFSSQNANRGIGSDIVTDRAGNVYYVWAAFNSRTIRLTSSTNGGASFGPISVIGDTEGSFIFPIPSTDRREVFIYAAADADLSDGPFADSLYVSWTDSDGPTGGNPQANHARIQVAYSRDGGNSWDVVTPHPTADILDVDRWHQWLAVGPDGTVHLIYYNTINDPSRTSVDVYWTFSTDGGVSWSDEQRLTSEASPKINDGFEFGDYNGLAATMDNIIAVFTDNRREGGGAGDSVDIYAAGTAIDGDGGNVDYTLADADPGIAGVENAWTTTNGTPDGFNLIYFGRSVGSTAVSIGQCDVNVSINNARPIAFAAADATGTATATRTIGAGAAGVSLTFQALDLRSCELSNVSTTTF